MPTAAHVLAMLVLVVVVASLVFNAAAYAGAARSRRRRADACPLDDEPPVPWPARAIAWSRALLYESAATAFVSLALPLGLRRLRVHPVDAADPRRPVVLVHGYAQHSANFLWLVRRLRRDGWVHVHTVGYAALGGDIARSGQRLAALIDRIRRDSGAPEVDIVAHSMGGLVARACIRTLGARGGVGRLVTLGTPHQGSEAFPRLGVDRMARQMRPGSSLLRELSTDDPVPGRVECTSIYSDDDALVVPPENAYYQGALNVRLVGIGHLSLLFSRRVYELVRENLGAPRAGVARTGSASSG
jgi:pimeloyl-ACP methyl ester carboxylesterase